MKQSLHIPAALVLAVLPLAACATGPQEPPKLTEKQTMALEKELAGLVPGEKQSCISRFPQADMRAISDEVLLYRVSSRLIYKNELIGSCNGISRGDILVTKSFGSQLCRGDIAHVLSPTSRMLTGACALGDFIPYRKPEKKK